MEDSSPAPEDVKKRKIEGDVTMATVCDVIETITEPDKMLGPEVGVFQCVLQHCFHYMCFILFKMPSTFTFNL